MNLFVQPFDASGDVNPTVGGTILKHLPITDSMARADAVVVVVCWKPGYRFNPELLSINKPVILLDFVEFGWDAGDKENLLGRGALRQFQHLADDEWAKLDDWVRDNPPVLYFKRELFVRDQTERTVPIEFPCVIAGVPTQTQEEYNARPIEVFNCWGLSHPGRQTLHGSIFCQAHFNGLNVMDSWPSDSRYEKRNWVTIHSPHYARLPLEKVMEYNFRSKISVSMPGAGVKCFRSAEAPVGSIMALRNDDLAWSFPWVHMENCVRLEPGDEFNGLLWASSLTSRLYDIYRASQETIDRYRSERYTREYVLAAIKERL